MSSTFILKYKECLENIMDINLESAKEFDKVFTKNFGDKYTGFGKADAFEKVQRVALDCISLNNMLGGGLPRGRIIEVFGQNSAGKSALCTHFVASFQKQDKLCMWVDAEHAMDPEFMEYCGVNLAKLCKIAPDTAEEALEAIRTGLKMEDEEGNAVLDLIVLDSVAALVPSEEYTKDFGGGTVAHLARLMSQSLKQIATLAGQKGVTVVLINQERATNLMGYGKKSDTAGGNAIKYYTSVRLDLSRTGYLEDSKKKKVGQTVIVESIKNKTARPLQTATIELKFPRRVNGKVIAGVDVFKDVINIAIDNDIITRTGAWFQVPGHDKKLNGLLKVEEFYLSNTEEYNKLYTLVKELDNDTEEN